jgi:hypothetical protein
VHGVDDVWWIGGMQGIKESSENRTGWFRVRGVLEGAEACIEEGEGELVRAERRVLWMDIRRGSGAEGAS